MRNLEFRSPRTLTETRQDSTTLDGEADSTSTSASVSAAKEVKTAERQILRGIKLLERNRQFLNEKEEQVLSKTRDAWTDEKGLGHRILLAFLVVPTHTHASQETKTLKF